MGNGKERKGHGADLGLFHDTTGYAAKLGDIGEEGGPRSEENLSENKGYT
jgi:hypothetical protein